MACVKKATRSNTSTKPDPAQEAELTDLISREAARLIALEYISNSMERHGALEAIRALLAVQPDAGAIREAALNEADYDAGLLNDFGGGDVNWWHDYLRAEIERANEYWRALINNPGKDNSHE